MINKNKINDIFLYFSAVSFVMLLLFSAFTLFEERPAYEDLFNDTQGLSFERPGLTESASQKLASKKRNQKY